MPSPTIRIARSTNDLSSLTTFYNTGLGLQVLYSFHDHSGFDGVMLGHPDCPAWHLEFTYQHSTSSETSEESRESQGLKELEKSQIPQEQISAPSKENLLVFYLPDKAEWQAAVDRVELAGGKRVKSGNPYWDVCGVTFEDPDGWRVVLQNARWP